MTGGDRIHVAYMLECIIAIEEFTGGNRDQFITDRKTRDAVLRNLHTLSETSMRLSQSLRDNAPQVPWKDIRGFRNIVVHDYFGIDLDKVWAVVSRDLPALKATLLAMPPPARDE